MTADLSMAFEAARSVWDAADDTHLGDVKLHEVVFPKPVFTDDERDAQAALLKATEWTQPAVGAASLACRAVLNLVGLNADMMAGHSFGEISALAAAGALTDADVLRDRAAARRADGRSQRIGRRHARADRVAKGGRAVARHLGASAARCRQRQRAAAGRPFGERRVDRRSAAARRAPPVLARPASRLRPHFIRR